MLITYYCSYSSLPVMWVKICMCNQLCFMFCWACHDTTDIWVAEKNRNFFSYSSGGQTAKIKLLAHWLLLRHLSLTCRYLTYRCVFIRSSTSHSSSFLAFVYGESSLSVLLKFSSLVIEFYNTMPSF